MEEHRPETVIDFWFGELKPAQWFRKDARLDAEIARRFEALLTAAGRGELWQWRASARGCLAEVIVLDQFPRHIHRGSPLAFAWDPLALVLAQEAVAHQADRLLDVAWRAFLFMPYMHSESLVIHDEALRLFAQPGLEENLRHEQRHRDVLVRFGRYPHRNAALGRDSTPVERAFLDRPGSTF
ncbi:DUF924 family protein [Halomonas saccharevitans]|uniref:Uncharacterized conserved protein, DUF924 family n=1 Tax=Halomonas saccharevitans TaxID=416872 RepID=A0A1I6YU08_9GAMM|nr:DUF924 family protein [Halomonas saccharevitans]SFT53913.1 Uncharacterized conserved protein, DUF924 family [Halomonas saccharevitans]